MSVSDAQNQTTYTGFAVLELLGHRTRAGFVSETMIAGAPFLRIDIAQGEQTITEFYAASSLYGMEPCDEATARLVAQTALPGPVGPYTLHTALEALKDADLEAMTKRVASLDERLSNAQERYLKAEDALHELRRSARGQAPAQDVDEEGGDDDDEDRDDDDLPL